MQQFINETVYKALGLDILDTMPNPPEEVLPPSPPVVTEILIPHNYGIKESLRHLSFAIYCRYPRFWTFTKPLRTLAKKIYRLAKKILRR